MRIAYAIPVRHIEVLQDGTLAAMGIETSMVQPAQFPAKILTPLVVALAAPPHEAGPELPHRLGLRVVGPDLTEAAAPMDAALTLAPGPNTPAGWEVRAILRLLAHFEATGPGLFSIEMSADGRTPTTVAVMVQGPEVPPA